jgi:16S rRNA (guanine527-N7)-methyltransferase
MEKLKSGAQSLGINLTPLQLRQFEDYYRLLIDWNTRINLTSITDYDEVQVKHFLDSLSVASIDSARWGKGSRVIDIGTGAGLPGVPLKITFPDIKLTLLEATMKKTKFLEKVVDELGLQNSEIVAERAEIASHDTNHRESYDIVLSRAVAVLPTLAELMLPFCNIGGVCIVQKKGDIGEEIKQAGKAISVMGGKLREVKAVELKELDDNRWLVILDKISLTPANYPRRPGMPEKRPVTS